MRIEFFLPFEHCDEASGRDFQYSVLQITPKLRTPEGQAAQSTQSHFDLGSS